MSTPVRSTRADVSPIPDSPGTWRHPRLNEITRRRNATTFSEKNVRRIAYNVIALLIMWSFQLLARLKVDPQTFSSTFRYYLGWTWFALQLLPFIQIGLACLPLVRAQDDLSDIPLTATQRKLLGLAPSSAPPTPEARFSTPPRYSRTPSIAGSIVFRIVESLWRELVCQLVLRNWLAEPVDREADKRGAE
ncbi:nuclear pore complex component domain-containing protein [Hirsutella rhossiliensis]|uniref:Nuclear pore complex component domain-containing protein n=1 Tax=Hirsutella rhossiliensis TaxID=111463 RepID=A0A9P8SJ97_9HYPO|nr:nuclear pore complex component domain-containing protein [Hirsutella rhossiliensis]KAH0965073.1 nuclear pore complex component domain-containing protein [Hirsutella rhossiliensis]